MANGVRVLVRKYRDRKTTANRDEAAAAMLPAMTWPRMPCAERAGQVAELEQPGGQDDRRGQQERETQRVLVAEPAHQAAGHGDPLAADPRQQGQDLRGADPQGGLQADARQPLVGLLVEHHVALVALTAEAGRFRRSRVRARGPGRARAG